MHYDRWALRPMAKRCAAPDPRLGWPESYRPLPKPAVGSWLVSVVTARSEPSETAPRLHDRRHQGTDNRSGRGIICICFQEKRIA